VWYIAILDVIEWGLEETDRFETCKRDRAAKGRHGIDYNWYRRKTTAASTYVERDLKVILAVTTNENAKTSSKMWSNFV